MSDPTAEKAHGQSSGSMDISQDHWTYDSPPSVVELPDGSKRIVLSATTPIGIIVQSMTPDFAVDLGQVLVALGRAAGGKAESRSGGLVLPSQAEVAHVSRDFIDRLHRTKGSK